MTNTKRPLSDMRSAVAKMVAHRHRLQMGRITAKKQPTAVATNPGKR